MIKGKRNRKWLYILGLVLFIFYIFISARSVTEETILKKRWITSLESQNPVNLNGFSGHDEQEPIPFLLGDRFGYILDDGRFTINQIRSGYISMGENIWAEYNALPSSIQIMNSLNEPVMTIEQPRGYPLFLDDQVLIVGSEQNSLAALGKDGEELWVHDFPSPITCIDAASGFVLVGTLEGTVELLNSSGNQVFTPFEPGGSRLSVILGCAISRNASRLAIISGIDEQRFLLLEKSGDTYKVAYHEFLPGGFRRPTHISFVDNDNKVAYEKTGGLGIYDINSRVGTSLNLTGRIEILDNSGGDRFLFAVTSQGPKRKRLIAIRYPAFIVNEVPFKSDNAFLARRGNTLYLGGDSTVVSFELEKK